MLILVNEICELTKAFYDIVYFHPACIAGGLLGLCLGFSMLNIFNTIFVPAVNRPLWFRGWYFLVNRCAKCDVARHCLCYSSHALFGRRYRWRCVLPPRYARATISHFFSYWLLHLLGGRRVLSAMGNPSLASDISGIELQKDNSCAIFETLVKSKFSCIFATV